MIILFEGIDCSGKSTLIRKFSALFSDLLPIRHYKNRIKPKNTKASGNQMVGIYRGLYQQALEDPKTYHLFDRSHITEVLYGTFLRDYDPLKLFDWFTFEKKVKQEILLCYVETDSQELVRRFHKEKEDFLEVQEIDNLLLGYKVYLSHTNLEVIKIRGDQEINKSILLLYKKILLMQMI